MTRTSFLISLLTLLLLSWTGPVGAETADEVDCKQCVHQKDIAFGAVGTGRLRKGAVNSSRIQDGAVDWQKLATDLQNRIVAMEEQMAVMQTAMDQMQDKVIDNTVLELDGYLSLDSTDPEKPTALFAGANVQVVNGAGSTETVNGLGNLVVGYDETIPDGASIEPICSDGSFPTEGQCAQNGNTWAINHKSGSHNLVVGIWHRYSQFGGFVSGSTNGINRRYANVSGGLANVSSGPYASISGGAQNLTSGSSSSVCGGRDNTASGISSSISGGSGNMAMNWQSSISGGRENTTSGVNASVSGGFKNTASGAESTVSGGEWNTASALHASVSGGQLNIASEEWASVSGGHGREASGFYDWVAGELWQDQ